MEFELITAPHIIFGAGRISDMGPLVPGLGRRALLVVGGKSAEETGLRERLQPLFPVGALVRCAREPTVEDVEAAVRAGQEAACDVVVAVGGGSVLDCGKAAAGLLTNPGRLHDYLEGVGKGYRLNRPALPLIAAPTTAGTGSEVTKNAVISGPGFKKSIRSPLLVPRVALVDPALTVSVPPAVTASCGMDALVQLMEAYLSRNANPVTDGLALQGVAAVGRSLERVMEAPDDLEARTEMALASLLSGICLANAGLGAVHGLASPLGALFPVAHGVACAALLPQVMRANLDASLGTPAGERLTRRFCRLAEALTGGRLTGDDQAVAEAGIAELDRLQRRLGIPRLAELGVRESAFPALVEGARGSSMRGNPVDLTDAQIEGILRAAS